MKPQFDPKLLATATARAALVGVTVHQLRNDRGDLELVATRWHLTRAFASPEELQAWLDRLGAPA